MTNFRNVLLLTTLALGSNAIARAQNEVTFGIGAGQTTTGSGSIAVTVGGQTVPVDVPPGTGSGGIAAEAASALTAAGFTATVTGNEVTVTAGPGGAPLQNGGGIGSTDPGINRVKTTVKRPPAPVGGPPAGGGGAGRAGGGAVRNANPQAQAQQPGHIQVDVHVRKFVNGQWTLLWIQVQVNVQPGDNGQTVNARVKQMLAAAGMIVDSITLPPVVAPITPVPPGCFNMDRMQDGSQIQGIDLGLFGGAWDLFGTAESCVGCIPMTGAVEYDRSIDQFGVETQDFMLFQGSATVGGGGAIDTFVAPNQFVLWPLQIGPGGPDLLAPIVPLPLLGPGFYMPLDPFGALLDAGISDPLGQASLPLPIPPNPQLAGLELHTTALTLDPFGATLFDGVKRTNPLTVRVGN